MANTLASLSDAVKELYTADVMQSRFMLNRPLLDRLNKKTDFGGGGVHVVPFETSGGGGAGSTLALAQSAHRDVTVDAFNITKGRVLVTVQLGNELIGMENGLLFDYIEREIKRGTNDMGDALSKQIHGNGGGALGQAHSTVSNTVTLTRKEDAYNFFVGMVCRVSAGDGTNAGHSLRTGSTTVDSIDYEAGAVTFDDVGDWDSFDDDLDYIFATGIFAGNVSTRIITGVQKWIPSSTPSDTLFGVTRSDEVTSGFRLNSLSGGIVDRCQEIATHGYTVFNATPRLGVLHPKQMLKLSKALQSQGIREQSVKSRDGKFGYRTVTMSTVYGDVEFLADSHADPVALRLLDEDTWTLRTQGEIGQWQDYDGGIFKRRDEDLGSGDTVYEGRMATYGNLECTAPWRNGVGTLAAV